MLDLSAREEERVWMKRQMDGELDDRRLADGLTGDAIVYKWRGMAKPELGRTQIKSQSNSIENFRLTFKYASPKRIRFLFDVSSSMYRFQYDGRLQRSLETGKRDALFPPQEWMCHYRMYRSRYVHGDVRPTFPQGEVRLGCKDFVPRTGFYPDHVIRSMAM